MVTSPVCNIIKDQEASKLETGMVFDGDELIVASSNKTMTTVRHHEGFEDGRDYDIVISHYGKQNSSENGVTTSYWSSKKIFTSEEKLNRKYVTQLRRARIW